MLQLVATKMVSQLPAMIIVVALGRVWGLWAGFRGSGMYILKIVIHGEQDLLQSAGHDRSECAEEGIGFGGRVQGDRLAHILHCGIWRARWSLSCRPRLGRR